MERGQGGGHGDFGFGDPFAGFRHGFGRPSNLFPSLFNGRDPFDDPFFTQPFGGMLGPGSMGPGMFGPGSMGPGMFGPGLMGPSMFRPGFMGQIPPAPFDQHREMNFVQEAPGNGSSSRGLVIRELDEEEHGEGEADGGPRSNGGPRVQQPDEEVEAGNGNQVQVMRRVNRAEHSQQPQSRSYTFQSSRVTYGGVNGAYYTSSTTRRSGSDGITMEESREADTTTGRATHRVSRGIHDKGHSVTRRLNSDGRVDTAQMLHNLEEDELPKFEETWRENVGQHLPDMNHGGYGGGGGPIRRDRHAGRNNNALPSNEQSRGNGSSRSRVIPIA